MSNEKKYKKVQEDLKNISKMCDDKVLFLCYKTKELLITEYTYIKTDLFGKVECPGYFLNTINDGFNETVYQAKTTNLNEKIASGLYVQIDKKFSRENWNPIDKTLKLTDVIQEQQINRFKFKDFDLTEKIKKSLEKLRSNFFAGYKIDNENCITYYGSRNFDFSYVEAGKFEESTTYSDENYYKVLFILYIACVHNFFEVLKILLTTKYKNQNCEYLKFEKKYYESLLKIKTEILDICKQFGKVSSIYIFNNNILYEEWENLIKTKTNEKTIESKWCENINTNRQTDENQNQPPKSYFPDIGSYVNPKNAIGLGVGAAALYGLKKWRDYQNAKTDSSSSSSSSSSKQTKKRSSKARVKKPSPRKKQPTQRSLRKSERLRKKK